MHSWQWQHWYDRPYLTCSLLEDWCHGFFSRHFWPQPPQALTEVLMPDALPFRIRQVHGNGVLTTSEVTQHQPSEANPHPDADGVVAEAAHQAVWVCSADCNPVLIGDQRTRRVAAVHAGWRGTALKVVPAAIAALQDQGSQLMDLRVAIGPAIAGSIYQVSIQVAAQVGATITDRDFDQEVDLVEYLQVQDNPAIFADPLPDRARLDVRRVNALQLQQLGLLAEQIAIAPHCTYQEPEQFFSYRRTKEKKVQWSGIVSR
ncbi:peptidoglycan editing factor PgeF [filamentous cyanobacterium CCP5]|nr:peptidoglycan editing factor PgeF [filamentous cyanobacterium CCP5]